MAFTAGELANIANAVIDYKLRGPANAQTKQVRPLYDALMSKKKSFAGGKGSIDWPVKGVYTTTAAGYTHDDTVSYANPANIKRAAVNWYEVHGGISMTLTELKIDGISVVDSLNSSDTSNHSERELTTLTGLLEDKVDDMQEGFARSMSDMFWKDGTQDSKAIPGIRSFILNNPTAVGNTFGIDRVANAWWRNRFALGVDVSTPGNLNLVTKLQQEFRQLRRFGKGPTHMFCGSDFLDGFEKELRSKGNFTLEGWSKSGKIDASVADLAFKGLELVYEPSLDDLTLAKYCFALDLNAIQLRPMDGEDMKVHSPARPADKYVLYRAVTFTGAITANQLNTSGVYSIA
jgi:hypothetical protein